MGNNSLKWATEAGQNPAAMAVQTSAEFAKEPQAFLAKNPEYLKVFNYQYYGYAVEALDKIVLDTVFGKMDIKAGLQQAQKETEDRIASGK
jgi:multiple sugar transport system substrate-binding protein